MKRTFTVMLSALLLTVSVGTTATAKRVVKRDKVHCWTVFTPDEEMIVCEDDPPPPPQCPC